MCQLLLLKSSTFVKSAGKQLRHVLLEVKTKITFPALQLAARTNIDAVYLPHNLSEREAALKR